MHIPTRISCKMNVLNYTLIAKFIGIDTCHTFFTICLDVLGKKVYFKVEKG